MALNRTASSISSESIPTSTSLSLSFRTTTQGQDFYSGFYALVCVFFGVTIVISLISILINREDHDSMKQNQSVDLSNPSYVKTDEIQFPKVIFEQTII